nr:helix-turn-helix domain-containing protein [uncultured Lichenicoccus sp.]
MVNAILARVGDKWTMLVVMLLEAETLRFNEIKRRIGGISQRMLTVTLRGLERDGLVLRTVTPCTPPRVDYELSELGHSLAAAVQALGRWAMIHRGEVERARLVFDDRIDPVRNRGSAQDPDRAQNVTRTPPKPPIGAAGE